MSELVMEFTVESPKVRKYELLLSYHPEFSNQVKKFAEKLRQQTTWRVFLCSSDSNDTDDEVLDALRHSRNVVLFMSKGFHSSRRCRTILEWSRHFNNCISFLDLTSGDLNSMLNDSLLEQLDGQIQRVYEDERSEFKQELLLRRQQVSRFLVELEKKLDKLHDEFELALQVKYDFSDLPQRRIEEGLYMGFVNENEERHGLGVCYYKDKSFYTGEWVHDIRNGYGRYRKRDYTYEGNWVNNVKQGLGMERNKNGVYKGAFRNNLRNGFGFFNSKDDDVYGGEWKDGKFHGRGVYWYQIKTEVYDGEWKDNKRHGKGIYLNKSKERYESDWLDDDMHGNGILTYPNGDKFIGTWAEGKMHGNGVIEFKNGNRVEVVYKYGKKMRTLNFQINKDAPKHYEGDYEFDNGVAVYKGNLLNGVPDGVGTANFTNGYTYHGMWKNGKMHGTGTMKLDDGSFAMGEFKNDYLDRFTAFMKPNRMCNTKFCMNLQLYFDWSKAKPMTIRYRERLIHDADASHLHELFNRLRPNDVDCAGLSTKDFMLIY